MCCVKGLRRSSVFLAVGCTCLWRSLKQYLFQAGTWHPKKNALVGAASELGVESTVKLTAQDRQWCHSSERKYTAKVTHFPLCLYMFLFPWACHPGRSLDVFSALLSVISLASRYGLCCEILKVLRFLVSNSTPLHCGHPAKQRAQKAGQ